MPARLMKNWIMRRPEPGPLGLTRLLAMVRAIVRASLVKRPGGGRVETVLTLDDQRRVGRRLGLDRGIGCLPRIATPAAGAGG